MRGFQLTLPFVLVFGVLTILAVLGVAISKFGGYLGASLPTPGHTLAYSEQHSVEASMIGHDPYKSAAHNPELSLQHDSAASAVDHLYAISSLHAMDDSRQHS